VNILTFILFTLFQEIPTAHDPIVLSDHAEHINIGQQTFVLQDSAGTFHLEDILKSDRQHAFVRSQQRIITFPSNESFYWIKFNVMSTTEKRFVVFIDEAKFQKIDLYYKLDNADTWKILQNGYSVPEHQRPIAHNFQVFPLELSSGMRAECYLRVQPQLVPLPISIKSYDQFFQIESSRYNLILGLVLGIILFIAINNLALYFSSGGRLRLLYFVTALSFVLYSILFNGHVFLVSSFGYQHLLEFVIPFSFIGQSLVVLYGVQFLQVQKHVKWLYVWSMFFLATLGVLTFLSFFLSTAFIILCLNTTGILTATNCLLMGFLTWRKSNSVYKPTMLIYSCSYVLFLLLLVLEIGHLNMGLNYFFVARFIDIGFLCEATGLAIALSVHAGIDQKLLEEAKDKAQAENLLLISKQNQILEVRVNHRTFELMEKTKIAEQISNEYKLQSEQLREVNMVKDRLFSIISHDLRSPLRQLHSILSLTDKSQLSNEEITSLLRQVRATLDVNIQLTDNLLFWARSQMAGAKVLFQEFVLYTVVETKFQFFRHALDAKKIQTSNRIHQNLKIHSDENIVGLVLHNLLANAIKFCRQNDTIIVGSEANESDVVIYVRDTGVGMTSEDVQNILDSNIFTKQGTANEKGTGLGLKICKDLIHQLNGKLWIESEPGVGTSFYFSIPDMPRLQFSDNQRTLQVSA
jgi:signal transduction histidine kinase